MVTVIGSCAHHQNVYALKTYGTHSLFHSRGLVRLVSPHVIGFYSASWAIGTVLKTPFSCHNAPNIYTGALWCPDTAYPLRVPGATGVMGACVPRLLSGT